MEPDRGGSTTPSAEFMKRKANSSKPKKPTPKTTPPSRRKRAAKAKIDPSLPSAPATKKVAEDRAAAAAVTPANREPSQGAEVTEPHYPSPAKAYGNLDFLASPAARSIRIQCELTEPAIRFRKNQINHTIVLFGSARIPDPDRSAQELKSVEQEIGRVSSLTREQKSRLDRARRLHRAAPYYRDAVRLSHDLTKWSLETFRERRNRFYICSGGGPGIMEAANRGAREAGGDSVGLGISLPFEQHLNPYCTDELGFEFHYFFVRKYWFLYLAKALVVFPGGFGTLDELFEMLTLIQTQKARKYVPIVLYGKEFWEEVVNFKALVDWGVISEDDLHLFQVFDTVEETRDYLIRELIQYYR